MRNKRIWISSQRLPIERRSDRDFSGRRRDTGVPISTECPTNTRRLGIVETETVSLCRQQDLSSPPCPDVDKDAQSRSKPRRVAPRESRMNRKELARGDYPALAAYHRDIVRSLSPTTFRSVSISWLRLHLENRPRRRRMKRERRREGREGKRGGLLRGSSYTGVTGTHADGCRLDGNGMLHESCSLTLLRCKKAEPSSPSSPSSPYSRRARNVSAVGR